MIDSSLTKGINDELETLVSEVERLRYFFNHAINKEGLEPTINKLELERERFNRIIYKIRELHRSL